MKLLLVDGSAILHRAYHAMPGLTDRQGRPTGAVYGFVRMLLRAIKDLQPSHVAVAFDRHEPTFRKQIYIAYQAQRPEIDQDLIEQFQRVRELLKAMEIPVYEKAGFEADDIIGTIAATVSGQTPPNPPLKGEGVPSPQRRGERGEVNLEISKPGLPTEGGSDVSSQMPARHSLGEGGSVVILTGDKDMMQLVNDRVSLYLPIKGVTEAQLVGPKEVEEKLGIPPSLVIDYKALVGDPSDNYPGVSGIGPKTAVNLLHQFKSFDGIYSAIQTPPNPPLKGEGAPSPQRRGERGEVKNKNTGSGSPSLPKRGEGGSLKNNNKLPSITTNYSITDTIKKKLLAGREAGEISQDLARIRTDVRLDFNLKDCEAVIKKPGKLARVLEDYGFKTLAKQMELDKAVGGGVEQLKLT